MHGVPTITSGCRFTSQLSASGSSFTRMRTSLLLPDRSMTTWLPGAKAMLSAGAAVAAACDPADPHTAECVPWNRLKLWFCASVWSPLTRLPRPDMVDCHAAACLMLHVPLQIDRCASGVDTVSESQGRLLKLVEVHNVVSKRFRQARCNKACEVIACMFRVLEAELPFG